jgi:ubiquinone/menaquinone biosynthesis C-methylase UbiE
MHPVGFYGDQVLPRITNFLLDNKECRAIRERVASRLTGDVLEVGFGSGLNVPCYPSGVRRVLAVDPATVGRKLAAKRVAASSVAVEYVGLDGERIPLDSATVDHVLVTWTLCTIPAVDKALAEMHRVLRPGGMLHFAEHGRSPEPKVAIWQDRLNPLQRMWAGGCNLNRPIEGLITSAGFTVTQLQNFYMEGPRSLAYTYEGVATKT